MKTAHHDHKLDNAFDRIEEGILPEIAMMLDVLLDKAALDKPDMDRKIYAEKLHAICQEVEALTRQIEATSTTSNSGHNHRISSAA